MSTEKREHRKRRRLKRPNAWLTHEQISGLFERALNPGSTVNVSTARDRPDITGALRQLDVEIISGEENRQTRSIVEVQKRKQKVGIGVYEGWISKKRKLNAALLIGVSEKGFTRDVVKAATHDNPNDVKLGLLQIVEADDVHPHFKSKVAGFEELNTVTTYLSDFVLHTTDGRAITVGGSLFDKPLFGARSLHDIVSNQLLGRKPFKEELVEIILVDAPILVHEGLPDTPPIEKIIIKAKFDAVSRNVPIEYYLYKQVFPKEAIIGACLIADNIRMNNISGNLAMIMLPHPEGATALFAFDEAAS